MKSVALAATSPFWLGKARARSERTLEKIVWIKLASHRSDKMQQERHWGHFKRWQYEPEAGGAAAGGKAGSLQPQGLQEAPSPPRTPSCSTGLPAWWETSLLPGHRAFSSLWKSTSVSLHLGSMMWNVSRVVSMCGVALILLSGQRNEVRVKVLVENELRISWLAAAWWFQST